MAASNPFLLLLPLLLLLLQTLPFSNAHFTATAFLDNLTDSSKLGDHHPAIAAVKSYLRRYGYLSTDDIDDDHFDELLESAIKTYQSNFKLDPTGQLDAATAAMMRTPRCGVPDVIDGTNWMMKTTPSKPHHRRFRFRTTARYNFFPGNPRWPEGKRNLTYGFLPGTPEMARRPVARAFKKWGAHSHGRFAFSPAVEDYGSADIKIGFFTRYHGDAGSFDGPGGSLAHSSPPKFGLLHFDAEESWAVGPVQKAFDVETVALHEIGHILGLMHSSVPTAIMYPALGDGVTKKLSRDDVHGFRALYNV